METFKSRSIGGGLNELWNTTFDLIYSPITRSHRIPIVVPKDIILILSDALHVHVQQSIRLDTVSFVCLSQVPNSYVLNVRLAAILRWTYFWNKTYITSISQNHDRPLLPMKRFFHTWKYFITLFYKRSRWQIIVPFMLIVDRMLTRPI